MTKKRTTKALAARIQVDYLRRRLASRFWKRVLLIASLGGAALWVTFGTLGQKKEIHLPGPTSGGHRLFEKTCGECHLEAGGNVPSRACLKCHSDHRHEELQVLEPRCADCHLEHRGEDLARTPEPADCAVCHADLKLRDGGKPEVATKVRTVEDGHPEFRFFQQGGDRVAILLNHKVHMKPHLKGPRDQEVTLRCSSCHGVDLKRDPEGIYRNAPISYEAHCQDCHPLGFDPEFPAVVAPHKQPQEVVAFVQGFYREELSRDPEIFLKRSGRSRPGPEGTAEHAKSGGEWLDQKLDLALGQLWGRICLECHPYQKVPGTLPQVAKVQMRSHYLERGFFDHAAHRAMACASCHVKAMESEKSSDHLVPSLSVCLQCHRRDGMAEDSCFECHQYHSEGPEKVMEGTVADF